MLGQAVRRDAAPLPAFGRLLELYLETFVTIDEESPLDDALLPPLLSAPSPHPLAGGNSTASDMQLAWPEREWFAVPWEAREEPGSFQQVAARSTLSSRAALAGEPDDMPVDKAAMAPLVPKIEAQECLGHLVRSRSAVSRAASRKYIPRARSLLDPHYAYKCARIPEAFRTPCFRKCALVGSSGVLKCAARRPPQLSPTSGCSPLPTSPIRSRPPCPHVAHHL